MGTADGSVSGDTGANAATCKTGDYLGGYQRNRTINSAGINGRAI